ncbi:hypothetical protein Cni_G02060 [Canna indica]|uniref:Secreted protein n=1 Tax=Canna indica TaxID=4628 RepID=A0AAQ3JNQ8_9LILI|nr:hypothetical protein Cni_G02060 [Canna indica]
MVRKVYFVSIILISVTTFLSHPFQPSSLASPFLPIHPGLFIIETSKQALLFAQFHLACGAGRNIERMLGGRTGYTPPSPTGGPVKHYYPPPVE